MKVYLGADHGGFSMKERVKEWLNQEGVEVVDMGAENEETEDDFVDYGIKVAEAVEKEEENRGVLFCRNGVGMSIVANRYTKIRCVLGFNDEQVKRARSDDDTNVLAIPADYLTEAEIKNLIEVFLNTEPSNEEKYKRRIGKIPGCTC